MVVRINKKNWIHYFLIYFLIIINQSCLYEYFLRKDIIRIGILCLFGFFMLLKYRKRYNKYILIAGVLLACTIITRVVAGGIGITAWVGYMIPIIVCAYTINYDSEKFLERFVKLTVFLAAVGIVLFAIQIINPELLKTILQIEYNSAMPTKIWINDFSYTTTYNKEYGLFLYSFRDRLDALMRNKGLFTESGVCQMLYNAALFILLYFSEKVDLTKKQFKYYALILIGAIVTVQSTTGYIILGVLLIGYVVVQQKSKMNIKGYIVALLFIGVTGLFVDLSLRGSESFLNITIMEKLFGSNNKFEIQANGMIRINTVTAAIQSMFAHPFGVGADKFVQMQYAENLAGGGGGIFTFGAMAGIVPFLICILLYIIPIIKANIKPMVKLLMLFMIFDTLFAQSNPFYSLMVMFPVYLIEERCNIFQNNKNIE